MRKRIYLNMCILALGVLIVTSVLVSLMFYRMNKVEIRKQMSNEASTIASALIRMEQEDILDYIQNVSRDNKARITIMEQDGQVIYDSTYNPVKLENHICRPEVAEAVENGEAFEIRTSVTMKKRTSNYALKMDNGTILRISSRYVSVREKITEFIPLIVVVFICVIILALGMAWKMSQKIIEPINNIDIHNPQTDFVYQEFYPLLKRIGKYNKERTKNEKLRREFSANVSHELKTPITSISGYAQLIQNGMVQPEDIQVFAGKIVKESDRLIHLVDDIIKLSRLDEKKNELDKVMVDFKEVSYKVWESLQPVAERYKVKFEMSVENVRHSAVELMMEELLYNLCENALKYNKPGGFVLLTIEGRGDNVYLEVKDNGIGIPKECQSRIFERFYRVDKSHSKQIGGTGLGLAIVKHVVEYHEGNIEIESEINEGTTIMVTLK